MENPIRCGILHRVSGITRHHALCPEASGRGSSRPYQLGGRLVSRWASFGLGLAVFAVLVGTVYAATSWQEQQSKITIGSRDSVYFSGSATREQAVALGNMLKAGGYFTDRGVDVLLTRDKDGVVLSFITKVGAWQDPEMVSSFDELGREAAPILGGFLALTSSSLKAIMR